MEPSLQFHSHSGTLDLSTRLHLDNAGQRHAWVRPFGIIDSIAIMICNLKEMMRVDALKGSRRNVPRGKVVQYMFVNSTRRSF